MRHRRLLVVAALLAGCGGAPAGAATTTSASVATSPEARARREEAELAARIRELESRLALSTAEVRDLRGEIEHVRREPQRELAREVVRIGGTRAVTRTDEHTDELVADDTSPRVEPHREAPHEERGGSRPVLRLYGAPRPAAVADGVLPFPGSQAPSIVPPPPQVAAFGRLPPMITPDVPAIPDAPLTIAPMPPRTDAAPAARAPEDDPVVREYQAALAHVEARRWDTALAALTRFVASHPEHPYADNALFWQGEVHYARREYRAAIERLEALVARYPQGNKVPDALVRIGAALEHLGDREGARAYFRRVREQYPDSVAARMALREET